MPNAQDPSAHVNPDTIAAFAEGRLDAPGRDAVVRHLATCPDCRRDVVHIVRLRRRPVQRWLVPAGVLAAAAVLFLMINVGGNPPDRAAPSSIRSAPEPRVTLGVIAPDSVITIAAEAPQFIWRPAERGVRYAFTLTTESGSRVFSTETTDTTVLLPPRVVLERGVTYLWFVDALRTDGQSVTTGVHVVRTLP